MDCFFLIRCGSYLLPSRSALCSLSCYIMEPETKGSNSNINTGTPKQLAYWAVKWYQSNMVSMSSTTSPITPGSTWAGTHNSTMAQRSRRQSSNLQSICTWGVAEIQCQCRVAGFMISITTVIRMLESCKSQWEFERQYDMIRRKRGPTARKSRATDRKFLVETSSAPKVLEKCRMKHKIVLSRRQIPNRHWGAPTGGRSGVHNEIGKRQPRQRSTDWDWVVLCQWSSATESCGGLIPGWGVPNEMEECQS